MAARQQQVSIALGSDGTPSFLGQSRSGTQAAATELPWGGGALFLPRLITIL